MRRLCVELLRITSAGQKQKVFPDDSWLKTLLKTYDYAQSLYENKQSTDKKAVLTEQNIPQNEEQHWAPLHSAAHEKCIVLSECRESQEGGRGVVWLTAELNYSALLAASGSQSELLYSSSGIRLNAAYTNLSWRRRINKLWWETSRWSRTVWGQREVQEARGRQTAECVLYKNTFSIHEVWSRAK